MRAGEPKGPDLPFPDLFYSFSMPESSTISPGSVASPDRTARASCGWDWLLLLVVADKDSGGIGLGRLGAIIEAECFLGGYTGAFTRLVAGLDQRQIIVGDSFHSIYSIDQQYHYLSYI